MDKCKHENSKFSGRNKSGIIFHKCEECEKEFRFRSKLKK